MKIRAKKLVSTKNMSRQEWLTWRMRGLGGSDISGLLGMNKWTTPFQVYISKVEPPEETEEQSEAAEWGTRQEPLIRQKFKENHPELLVRQSHFMWCHPEYEFMTANVDGFIHDKEKGWGVLEIKTASEYRLKEWDGEEVPEEYLLQAQHYLSVLGLSFGYFAVLIGGNKYREFYFERNEELIDYLITLENNFWHNHVLAKVPPALDGSEASEELVKKMYPPEEVLPKSKAIALPSEAKTLLEVIDETKQQLKEIEFQKKEAENKLKQLMGEYQVATFGDRQIKWTSISSNKFDKNTFAKEHPELFEKYLQQSSHRRLSV